MFNPAGIGFRNFRCDTCRYKSLCKKAMPFINSFSDLPPNIGQVKQVIFVHCEKATIFQGSDRHTNTRF